MDNGLTPGKLTSAHTDNKDQRFTWQAVEECRFLPAFRRQGYAADALKMKETENCIVPFPT